MQLQGEIKLQYIVALDICVLRLCAQHDIATSKDGCQDDCPHHFTADLWIMSLYFQMKWKMTAVAQKWGMGYTWQFLLYTSTPRTIIPASSYNPTWWWKEQKSSWIACERTCPHFPCNWLLQRPIDCKYLSICRLIVVPSGTWHCCAYTNWFDEFPHHSYSAKDLIQHTYKKVARRGLGSGFTRETFHLPPLT